MQNSSIYKRRIFLKSLALAGFLASTTVKLKADQALKHTTTPKILKGNEFHLTIDQTIVNFTGTPTIATTVNASLPIAFYTT